MKVVVYECPIPGGGTERTEISPEEAIKLQREAALQHGCCYVNDKEALEDFMTIHWAWKEE